VPVFHADEERVAAVRADTGELVAFVNNCDELVDAAVLRIESQLGGFQPAALSLFSMPDILVDHQYISGLRIVIHPLRSCPLQARGGNVVEFGKCLAVLLKGVGDLVDDLVGLELVESIVSIFDLVRPCEGRERLQVHSPLSILSRCGESAYHGIVLLLFSIVFPYSYYRAWAALSQWRRGNT